MIWMVLLDGVNLKKLACILALFQISKDEKLYSEENFNVQR